MKQVTDMIEGKAVTSSQQTTNPFTIMQEIAQACYLEDVLFSTKDSAQRLQVYEWIERTQRTAPADLVTFVNDYM